MAPAAMTNNICVAVFVAFSAMPAESLSVKSSLGVEASDFDAYVQDFNRGYRHDEHEYGKRRVIFERNTRLIKAQNSNDERLWTAGFNELTDRSDEELAQLRGWKRTGRSRGSRQMSLVREEFQTVRELPDSIDWTSLRMAKQVPDQSSCGSCWAVATAAMLQGSYEVQMNGSSRTFSAQQLVSCTPNDLDCGGSGGCDGATVELAMEYIDKKGLMDETGFPYRGTDMACPSEQSISKPAGSKGDIFLESKEGENNVAREMFGLQRWVKLPENKARPLYEALQGGPVAVSVAASRWFLYSKGIFNDCSKDSVIDHAVVLFGYGKQSGEAYWKLRNSWGSSWGESGFIKLLRKDKIEEDEEYCGIDNDPKSGTACKPYPKQVTVCGMCGLFYDAVAVTFG